MTDPRHPLNLANVYVDACNDRDLEALDTVFPPEFVSHLRLGDVVGLDRFKALMVQFYGAFPDVIWTPVELFHTDERVVIRYYFEATHSGPFLGIPPTHRRVHVDACEVMVVRDRWVPEIWNYADLMGLAAQMNAPDPLALRL